MKYELYCKRCGHPIGGFGEWFAMGQKCGCGSSWVEARYPEADWDRLLEGSREDLYRYLDFLPLEKEEAAVSLGEGSVPIERWPHLERAAQEQGVRCEVWAVRNDLNGGTGTFKDIGASLAASVLKEHGVEDYCICSTGNAALAFATYLAQAGIRLTEFAPSYMEPELTEAIRRMGQQVRLSAGGYGQAKAEAAAFSSQNGVLMSLGNLDPLRVESKRTLVFESLRQMGGLPTVYVQAVAGGTGPIAFEKGVRDARNLQPGLAMPRMVLAQQNECDPMVCSWERAMRTGFAPGWEEDYLALKNTRTRVHILSAADPGNYPILAPMVKESGGAFVRVEEQDLARYGRQVMQERGWLMGPASAVCYGGFVEALQKGLLHNGDRVLLNLGEGCRHADWFRKEVEDED